MKLSVQFLFRECLSPKQFSLERFLSVRSHISKLQFPYIMLEYYNLLQNNVGLHSIKFNIIISNLQCEFLRKCSPIRHRNAFSVVGRCDLLLQQVTHLYMKAMLHLHFPQYFHLISDLASVGCLSR